MNKIVIYALMFLTLWRADVNAQSWKEIVPLVSSCDDIKAMFGISECEFPTTWIDLPKYSVTVRFPRESDEWIVSKETVVNATVILHDLLKLSDFETDFASYTLRPEVDVENITVYDSREKGVRLDVHTAIAPEPYISSIFLYPTAKNAKRFKCNPPG